MALSATIGNPGQIRNWLQSVKLLQQQQDEQASITRPASYKVNLIQYSERYADLRYYRFETPAAQADSEDEPANQHMLQKLHPCAVLDAQQLQRNDFPGQLNLEPSDCLELFNAMKATVQECVGDAGGVVVEGPHTQTDKVELDQRLRDLIKKRPEQDTPVNVDPQPVPAHSGDFLCCCTLAQYFCNVIYIC